MSQENISSDFIVTARKWRPLIFKDVVGQEHITVTLKNAIKQNRLHHAFLFSGPRGVGKTTTARILSRVMNCENPVDGEPCNECISCTSILDSRSLDVIEIDGASNNSVDDIRKLRENAKYAPVGGKYKLYVIDEVHMLSTSAFNALLKTLEEPPPHLMFVFATTEPHKVPATILSRCQRYEFRRMEIDDIISRLKLIAEKEQISIDDESLYIIAKKADGSMRDSQSIFDQVVAFCGKDIIYTEMAEALHLIDVEFFFRISLSAKNQDLNEMFNITKEVITKGYDLQECLNGLLEHYRNILTVKVTNSINLIESTKTYGEKYLNEAALYSISDLLRIMNLISTTESALKFSPQPKIRFELALIQLASIDSAVDITNLIEEIKSYKSNSNSNNPIQYQQQQGIKLSNDIKESNSNIKKQAQPFNSLMPQGINPKIELTKNASLSNEKSTIINSLTDITAESLMTSWDDFIDKYATTDTGLHNLKQHTIVKPEFMNGEVILNISVPFYYDDLSRRKQIILQSMNEFFGKSISVKIIKSEATQENTNSEQSNISEVITGRSLISNKENIIQSSKVYVKTMSTEGKHPFEVAIIEKLGGRELRIT